MLLLLSLSHSSLSYASIDFAWKKPDAAFTTNAKRNNCKMNPPPKKPNGIPYPNPPKNGIPNPNGENIGTGIGITPPPPYPLAGGALLFAAAVPLYLGAWPPRIDRPPPPRAATSLTSFPTNARARSSNNEQSATVNDTATIDAKHNADIFFPFFSSEDIKSSFIVLLIAFVIELDVFFLEHNRTLDDDDEREFLFVVVARARCCCESALMIVIV